MWNIFGNRFVVIGCEHIGNNKIQFHYFTAFYSDDLSLNPGDANSFSCNIVFEKNENKPKNKSVVGPLF